MLVRRSFRLLVVLLAGVIAWGFFLYVVDKHALDAADLQHVTLSHHLHPLSSSTQLHRGKDGYGYGYGYGIPPSDDDTSASAAARYCASHGYRPFEPDTTTASRRKVYDLFMMNTELDLLELRLETLYPYVDYFVIVESPLTFQGREKNLTIRDSWARFEKYHPKLIYHLLQFPAGFTARVTWDYEDLQRDSMFTQVFPRLQDGQAPKTGDVLIVADVDEIPRPETIRLLRKCIFPRRLTLYSRFYYYSFQFLHSGPEWHHPQATFYDGRDTVTPSQLRSGTGGSYLQRFREKGGLSNAAWHCSSCFGTVEQFLNKMASFSHVWMNGARFRDRDRIARAVREGVDLWGRRSEKFVRVEGNEDLPGPLAGEFRERFGYMISRDGESAGFMDYP